MIRRFSNIVPILLLVVTCGLLFPHVSFAGDEFSKILKSKQLKTSKAKRLAWLRDGSNLAKIFAVGGRGVQRVIPVLASSTPGFRHGEEDGHIEETHAEIRKDYFIRHNFQRISMLIRIPPRPGVASVRFGLVKDFLDFEPPNLKVKSQEDVVINGLTGTLFHSPTKMNCSLLFKIGEEARLQLTAARCEDNDFMLQLAELIHVERLDAFLRQ